MAFGSHSPKIPPYLQSFFFFPNDSVYEIT